MSDKILEQVSALTDGELPDREAEMLFVRLSREEGLRKAWQDYHLVGDAMRRGLATIHDTEFAGRVMAALDDVEQETARPGVTGQWLSRLRPVAGLAVAASVAMVAVFTLQQPQVPAPAEIVPTGSGNPATVPMLGTRQVDFTDVESPELQNQLRGYLLNHNEHAASAPMRGLMPYVQITARDTRPVDAEGRDLADPDSSEEIRKDDQPEAGRRDD